MLKFIAFAIGLCLNLSVAYGNIWPAQCLAEHLSIDTARLDNALLWRVSHPDDKDDSYVFGTIHIISDEAYFLPEGTEQAMNNSDKIVFEIDMKEMSDMGAQMALLSKAFMNNGTRLKDLMTAEDYALVKSHFEEIGLPMMMMDRIKPMFLTVFASSDVSPTDLSTGEMKSYEMEFFDFAEEHQKETGGLETIEFQLSVFDSIPYKAQAEMLVESIRGDEEQTDLFDKMIELYQAQDIEALYSTIGDEESGAGEYEDILIKNRNERWMEGMGNFMKEGPTFFAVGAGHLGGPNGVIRLLRNEGYTVTPYKVSQSHE